MGLSEVKKRVTKVLTYCSTTEVTELIDFVRITVSGHPEYTCGVEAVGSLDDSLNFIIIGREALNYLKIVVDCLELMILGKIIKS